MKPRHKKSDGQAKPWLRLWTDILENPKMQRLDPALFKALVNFWCLARRNGGCLPDNEDIAWTLRITAAEAEQFVEELVERGFLEHGPHGEVYPHNWNGRQYDSDTSTDRVRAFRERKAKGIRNNDETFHETSGNSGGNSDEAPRKRRRNGGATVGVTTSERPQSRAESESDTESLPPGGLAKDGFREDETPAEPTTPPEPSPLNTQRGSRLPENWKPSEADLTYAAQRGMKRIEVPREIEKFKLYWTNKPGKAGVMLDWSRTWKTWVLRATDGRIIPQTSPTEGTPDWKARVKHFNETGTWPSVFGSRQELPAEYHHLLTRSLADGRPLPTKPQPQENPQHA